MNRRIFLSNAGLLLSGPAFSFFKLKNIYEMDNNQFELISHHLCPFLHRSIILLEKKGLKQGIDFSVTRIPIYDLPKWLFEISPKGSMPVLKLTDTKILLRSIAINAYFDETIKPSFLPEDAYERAVHRALILTCGDLLDQMRNVYTSKEETAMNTAINKLFTGLKDAEKDLLPIIAQQGQNEAQMVECSFGAFFTLMLNFDKLRNDKRWYDLQTIRDYADKLIADPIVIHSKSPDYNGEFNKFFNYFGSVFNLMK
ncbi:MAG: glutathione S-transferase N-terminal domain-containing protein [Flammeovirgaceae bacterium]